MAARLTFLLLVAVLALDAGIAALTFTEPILVHSFNLSEITIHGGSTFQDFSEASILATEFFNSISTFH